MNLALLLAGVDGVAIASIEALMSESGAYDQQEAWLAVREYALARGRGDAAELAALLRPLWVDEWREIGAPAILRVETSRQDLWSGPTLELNAFEGRVVRSGRHFEAWHADGWTIITPQDRDSREMTIDLVVPHEAGESVALATVSAPVRAGEWDAVAGDLKAQARRLPGPDDATPTVKCKEAMVRGPDWRWRTGCVAGACETDCAMKVVPGDQGVDSFRCDCRPVGRIGPVDGLDSEDVRESSA